MISVGSMISVFLGEHKGRPYDNGMEMIGDKYDSYNSIFLN